MPVEEPSFSFNVLGLQNLKKLTFLILHNQILEVKTQKTKITYVMAIIINLNT